MDNYIKFGLSGAAFGVGLTAGSIIIGLNTEKFARALNPGAIPSLTQLETEKRNWDINRFTIDNTENILACVAECYNEKRPVEAKQLSPLLARFNDWNKEALGKTYQEIQRIEKNPAVVAYREDIRALNQGAGLGVYVGTGIMMGSSLITSGIGAYLGRRTRKSELETARA